MKALDGLLDDSSLLNSFRASEPEAKWILAWGSRAAISLSQRLVYILSSLAELDLPILEEKVKWV